VTTNLKLSKRLLQPTLLDPLLIFATLALGLVHSWVGRYTMNPDGMSYLDVGESFFRRDWAHAVNAWWSPLYPWIVGLVVGAAKPSPRWEFPLVHAVNFVIFILALLAFRFLVHALLAFRRERIADESSWGENGLADWALLLMAYPIFWWIALETETVYAVSPDLAVVAFCSLIAGMLLRLRSSDAPWKFAWFGLILAVGYWTKAVLFPLGFVILLFAYLWKRSERRWRLGIAVASAVFLAAAAPLIFLLSHQKGRFTFGDSGRVNYAWNVAPRTQTRNWQGEEPESGTPAHATRQLLRYPPVFEFDGPVVGTYPPWTDPSYWNEGLQGHFRLKPQLEVLAGTIPSEIRLVLLSEPGLVVGILVFALIGGLAWWGNLRSVWPLLGFSLIGLAVYLPLLENDRYLGGFVLVLLVVLLAAAQFRAQEQRTAICVAVAVFVAMAMGTADYTVRVVTNHLAIPGVGPNSTFQDAIAAEQLWRMGILPGDKVAVIGDGTGAYWARLAKLRIVAEIMGMNHGAAQFWAAPDQVKQEAYQAFAKSHAVAVVASCPSPPPLSQEWRPLEGTRYCVRPLLPDK
jgi:hypothetical protein